MIECKNIEKSFKNNNVINDVSLKIENGKITSIIGKNGAGKSTLINLIVDYYNLNLGVINKKRVSVMPDADNMYASWTGIDFLKFMSKIKGANLSEALDMAEILGLSSRIKNKISTYSFGMKKKLSFIQCAIGSFDAYIFDEPTSGVDVPSALLMLDMVKKLKEQGASILLTSHNIDELERVSDYIYLLEEGNIIKEGTVSSFINTDLEMKYSLVSQFVKNISEYSWIKPYFSGIDEINNTIELTFSDEEEAMMVLRKIILQYPVQEYYRKRESLIETVYETTDL